MRRLVATVSIVAAMARDPLRRADDGQGKVLSLAVSRLQRRYK